MDSHATRDTVYDMSIVDVCSFLNLSNSALYNLRLSDSDFPKGVKDLRGRVMFSKEEIEE